MDDEKRSDLFETEEIDLSKEIPDDGKKQPMDVETNSQNQYNPEPEKVETQQVNINNGFNQQPPRSQYPPYVAGQQGAYSYQPPRTSGAYTNPYNTGAAYSQQGNGFNTAPTPKPKKKKKGLAVFLLILVAIVLISVTALVTTTINKSGDDNDQSQSTVEANESGPELEIEDSNTSADDSDATVKEGTVLEPTQIASRASKISVGIFVYSGSTKSLSGEGSGIIMGLDDNKQYTYIITCAHVVSSSGITVSVETYDDKTYEAEIVGVDSRTDVAVLKIKTNKYAAATFGNSNNLKVGEDVYAIGNPGGTEFSGSFTEGIVSAIERPVSSEIGYTMKCLQHTAAINPGNSGGALLNSYGQVIGINSSKIIASGYEGMGFAIPITDAQVIVNKLIKYGYITDRAKLGISYYTASSSEQYSMLIQLKDLPAGSLIIGKISEDSDLYGKAEVYDIITAVDGEKLTSSDVLLEKIENGKVGQELKLSLARFDNNYKMTTFDVTVKLVEDKGTTGTSESDDKTETTTQYYFYNPFE